MNKTLKENREMKDSGIDWIGKIPKEWDVRKLSSKYTFHTGFTPDTKKTEFYDDEGFNWVTISDLNKSKVILDTQKKISELGVAATKGTLTPKGSLLYSFKLSVGQVGIAGKDLYTNEAIASFTPNQNECLNFLYYSSQVCIIQNANENIYGAKLLNQELIKSAKIVLPPLNEQQDIANYLDKQVGKIDELIVEQNQAIENWKNYKQSLITETVTKGLNPNVEMKDSGIEWIGEIPKAWEVRKLKSIGDTIIGLTYSPEDVTDNGVLVLRSSNVQNGKIVLSDNVFVNKEIKDKLITQVGDILICSRNGSKSLIGKSALITESIAGNTFGAFMTVFRTKHYKFVYYALNSSIFSYYIGSFLTSTINQLTTENLKNIKIALPSSIEQQQIVDFLDEKCSKIDQTIEQKQVLIQQLEEYKQSLIYECVTGKRCVL